jgi:DNA-binding PadR family transcriptional regulator
MLEEGGFLTSEQSEGKRVYTITDSGRQLLAGRTAQEENDDPGQDGRIGLRMAAVKLAAAVVQAARTHDGVTEARAKEILDRARRDIYKLLADEESQS